jgi:acid stress-induced BolA-like protein IbaG/YrbA
MQASEVQALIKAGLPDAEVIVKGEGDHFEAVVVSRRFADCTVVQQHRLVYATLGDRMGGEIHALALRTMTPESWQGSGES